MMVETCPKNGECRYYDLDGVVCNEGDYGTCPEYLRLTRGSMRLRLPIMKMWPPGAEPEEQCNLWEEIKTGVKTSEYRKAIPYWLKRLRHDKIQGGVILEFTVGYPKGGVPRLEAQATEIIIHCEDDTLELKFDPSSVVEVPA